MYTYQANDKTIEITVSDKAGNALDLTSGSAEYQLSKRGDETAVVSLSTGTSGVTLTDPANGVLEVDLSNTDTTIAPGTYDQQVRVTLASGKKYNVEGIDQITIRDSIFTSD